MGPEPLIQLMIEYLAPIMTALAALLIAWNKIKNDMQKRARALEEKYVIAEKEAEEKCQRRTSELERENRDFRQKYEEEKEKRILLTASVNSLRDQIISLTAMVSPSGNQKRRKYDPLIPKGDEDER